MILQAPKHNFINKKETATHIICPWCLTLGLDLVCLMCAIDSWIEGELNIGYGPNNKRILMAWDSSRILVTKLQNPLTLYDLASSFFPIENLDLCCIKVCL
jgi:hypothetical protein